MGARLEEPRLLLGLRTPTDHQVDLYVSRLDGTPAKRLTALKGLPQAPAFSPDGSQIAFLYVEGATRPAGALAAMKPPSGVIGEDGVEVQRVAVARVDAEAAQPRIVTPANLHVYEFDWAPDSKAMAYIAAEPPGENNWWVAKLYTQSLDGQPKPILAPADRLRSASRIADCRAPLVARRKDDCLHRRSDERSGFHRRRCLDRVL